MWGAVSLVINPEEHRIRADAQFAPLIDLADHDRLLATLNESGKSQRGKPRARNLAHNPLGCRVFDAQCGWPMYRTPKNKSYTYKCGLYQQSHGTSCSHNWVDGALATAFMLSCVRQHLLRPRLLARVEQRLHELARGEQNGNRNVFEINEKRQKKTQLESDLDRIGRNLARAASEEQYTVIAADFETVKSQLADVLREIALLEQNSTPGAGPDTNVEMVLEIIRRLPELSNAPNLPRLRELFDLINARLFLRFERVKATKRVLNKVAGGMVTFGRTHPPLKLYEAPTARKRLKLGAVTLTTDYRECPSRAKEQFCSGREEQSLGNVSRGDRI